MASVLGASVHYGRAELVAVSAEPRALARWTADLSPPGLPDAPYHHEAPRMPLAEAEELVARVRRAVRGRCAEALEDARDRHGVKAVVLEQSPYPILPERLSEVLASWPLTCAADGMLYRETLAECAASMSLDVVRTPRRVDLRGLAASELGCEPARVDGLLKGFGASLGRPWRKDHQHAATAALIALARRDALHLD